MFSSKNYSRNLFWIGFAFCTCFYSVAVKTRVRYTEKVAYLNAINLSRTGGTANNNLRRRLQRIYTPEIGVREATGKNDGPEVEKYLRYIGLSKGNSYCGAFVCWALGQAGIHNPRNGWAPALFPTKRVVWERKKYGFSGETRSTPLRSAQGDVEIGDVFGIYFSELKRIGHCGFVDSWDGTWMISVEANTNNAGAITSPDDPGNPIRAGPGEGVYRKKRLIKTIYKVANWISYN